MHDERLGCYKWCGNLTCSAMGGGCVKKKSLEGLSESNTSKIDWANAVAAPTYAPREKFIFTQPKKPVGFWYITSSFSIAVYDKKPDEIHIKNHELLLGWKWKDADDVSNVHETKGTSSGGPS